VRGVGVRRARVDVLGATPLVVGVSVFKIPERLGSAASVLRGYQRRCGGTANAERLAA
jgi:hypothetical protein